MKKQFFKISPIQKINFQFKKRWRTEIFFLPGMDETQIKKIFTESGAKFEFVNYSTVDFHLTVDLQPNLKEFKKFISILYEKKESLRIKNFSYHKISLLNLQD